MVASSRWMMIAVGATLGGCGADESEDPQQDVSADAEACEHLEEGPAKAVTAAAAADDTAPALGADHTRYDVALVDVAGELGGFAAFAASEAADHVFFLNADVPVAFEDADGTAVPAEESAQSSAECALVKGRHLVPLEVGTVYLRFGPTPEATVSLVIEEAAHAEHE